MEKQFTREDREDRVSGFLFVEIFKTYLLDEEDDDDGNDDILISFFSEKIYHLQFPPRKKLVKKNPPSTSVTTTPWSNCSWLNNDRREKCLWDSLHLAKSRPHSWLSDCPLTAAPPLPVDGKHTSVPWHFTFSDSFIKIRLNLFQAAARTMSNTDDLSSHWRCFQPDRSFF